MDDDVIVLTCSAVVPLPSLCGCPSCGMTDVVEAENPIMRCSWCGTEYFPEGVLEWIDRGTGYGCDHLPSWMLGESGIPYCVRCGERLPPPQNP